MQAWQVRFILTKDNWQKMEPMLSEQYEALVVKPIIDGDPKSDESVALIFPDAPDKQAMHDELQILFNVMGLQLPEITIEALPDIDWLQHVYETLKPIETGRFFVHGSHIKQDIPADKVAIVIEAAAAFGTGEHPTTKGCLMMLDKYLQTEQPKTILDMGCGSGILAIAAAAVLPETKTILGVDIDIDSIRVANRHAVANHLSDRLQFIHGDGFHEPIVMQHAPYDLVFGNILAQPLMDMAESFCKAAARDLLLSGFTDVQCPYVEKAYISRGCKVVQADNLEGWMTLWLRKN